MSKRNSVLLLGLILVLRLAIAGQYRGNFDSRSYLIVAGATLAGQNVYAETDRYNYSPIWSYFVAGLWKVSAPNASLFVLLIGLALIGVDLISTLLVYRLASRSLGQPPEDARRSALLFFSNPISILLSCAHGQFDNLSILFLLLAISAAASADTRRRGAAVAAFLSASLLVKQVTALHIPLFWKRIRRDGYPAPLLAVPYLVFAASFWPYRSALRQIVRSVVFYGVRTTGSQWQRPGGWPMFLRFEPAPEAFSAVLFLAVVGLTIWRTRTLPLARAALILSLVNVTFLPSFGVQYLIWPVALGSLSGGIGYAVFSTAGALYHSSSPEGLALDWPLQVTALGTWLAGLLWLGLEVFPRERADLLVVDQSRT